MNPESLSLSELTTIIQGVFSTNLSKKYKIVAEISELSVSRTGHAYLDLLEKDARTQAIVARCQAVIWSNVFYTLKAYFETTTGSPFVSGIKVLITVVPEFHQVFGLKLNIRDIDPTYTLGDIARRRLEIIQRLDDDGIREMNKELEFPALPKRIAIISSEKAAGYRDFMQQLTNTDRVFGFSTKLFEATMQGTTAPESIIRALDAINHEIDNFDLVVIIRGGGAAFDLACFDDYDVAANIAQFPLPVLTGIGHDKDVSVADMVAYEMLKTPTAVAEYILDKFILADDFINSASNRLMNIIKNVSTLENERLIHLQSELRHRVHKRISSEKSSLERYGFRLKTGIGRTIQRQKQIFERAERCISEMVPQKLRQMSENHDYQMRKVILLSMRLLKNEAIKCESFTTRNRLLDPENLLRRGYSITSCNQKVIKDIHTVKSGDTIVTIVANGRITSVINNTEND